jgi:sigma-B regulation protein RsbU (phosphoserine phosphatase)
MHMIRKQPLSGNHKLLEDKLHLKELELNSLLEMTQAINANLSEESLYKIFHFTLIANLNIKKLALFVLDKEWNCKVNFGTSVNYNTKELTKSILKLNKITKAEGKLKGFEEFDFVIPVAHKEKVLAYVFAGGIENYDAQTDIPFIQTFANIVIVAIENKKLARKELEQEVFRKELAIARDVQLHLFPKNLPQGESLTMFASYLPSQMVGGDYYDYIRISEDKFMVCIADVSGKGMSAALLMSNFQASLRTLVRQTIDLRAIVNELNYIIKANARGERFITFFIATCDTKNRNIKYINAGHNPPVLVFKEGSVAILEKGTTVLGAFDQLPFIEEDQINITPDTLLFLYTDGLSETSNENDEEFDIEKIKLFLMKQYGTDLEKLHAALFKKINKFKGAKDFPDDVTFVSCNIS